MRFQQNPDTLPMPVLVLMTVRNVEEELAKCVPNALRTLDNLNGPGFYEVFPE